MSTTPLKRKCFHDGVEMDMASVPWADGTAGEGENSEGATRPHRLTPSPFHIDPRPDDFAHAGVRRGVALALGHVGFDSADAIAVESFALATEECMASRTYASRQSYVHSRC